jgi:anti-sigma regulatory factor (Ser/Thr protein kinase)
VTALDGFARKLPGAESTSVAIAFVDVLGQSLEYTLAGHPPPIIVSPTGEVGLLEDAIGRPIAILGDQPPPRPVASAAFPPGSLVIIYSDGLIERRRESLDVSLERLTAAVQRNWSLPLPLLCDALLDEMLTGRRRDDDAALLALRSPTAGDRLLLMKEPASPAGLRATRTALRDWLTRLGLAPDDASAVLVAVGEATTNAVEHAYGDQRGFVRVEATLTGTEIVCCVSDTGRWHDNATRTARGNGLAIMRDLMSDVVVHRAPRGTTVTLRFHLSHVPESLVLEP